MLILVSPFSFASRRHPRRRGGSSHPSDQIDADRLAFPGFRIGPDFKRYGLVPGDLIALAQCRDVEENVNAIIVRFNETKAFFVIEHLNFAGWHASLNFYFIK
jgi:hypothetical protein